MSHTHGPWKIGPHSDTLVVGANDRHVCTTGGYSTNTDDGQHLVENEANATLIAAAPDMEEALAPFAALASQDFWDQTAWASELDEPVLYFGGDHPSITRRDFIRASAALRKARGE